jgi:hypothetical protein
MELSPENVDKKRRNMNILEEALKLVNGDRQQNYGDIHDSFNRIAGFWSAYLGIHVDIFDVAKMMILLKVSRAKDNNHIDSYIDIAGYVACIEKLLNTKDI